MLEFVDLEQELSREESQGVLDDLKLRLGECQRRLLDAKVPLVIVFEGWDAAGKGYIINRLSQILDPRGFQVHPISAPTEEERFRPWMWRFWRALPPVGKIAIFDRSWYGRVLVERFEGDISAEECEDAYEDIVDFERQQVDSGTVILKFWLHIGKGEQKKRFKKIEADSATSWKVGKEEWKRHKSYSKWLKTVERMLQRTGTAESPWTIVAATQKRFLRLRVLETIVTTVERELESRAAAAPAVRAPMEAPEESVAQEGSMLDRLDLSLTLPREEYDEQLDKLQDRLFQLEHELYVSRRPAVIVYEGCDAAGKGGNIKRLTAGLDPRGYEVVPFGAPTAEERAHHYLWRFWREVPKAGHITIFDRSWYGRLLVERVEGFCTEQEWLRAYREINEFERQLAEAGTVIVKFWLQIDQEEQLRRFESRQQDQHKQWKITDEDWRNREKWPQYELAITDMLRRTSTTYSPWTVLEANCKLHARIKALTTVAEALEKAAGRKKD